MYLFSLGRDSNLVLFIMFQVGGCVLGAEAFCWHFHAVMPLLNITTLYANKCNLSVER